jgi:predicted amidohydrolase YtcJ
MVFPDAHPLRRTRLNAREAYALPDQNTPTENAAGNANNIPRRGFLIGAGTAVAAGAALVSPAAAQAPRVPAQPTVVPADVILKNGKVITVDAAFTLASAIAIARNRILAVGPDAAMTAHAAPATRVIDLKGRAVIPGVTDGHAHMDREGLRNVFPSLGRVRSIGDIQDRIAELARSKAPGAWIVTMPIGDPPYYFDVPDILAEKRWPTRQELDVAAPHNPVFIRSIWGYWRSTFPLVSIANTQALRLAGITRDTVSPASTLTIEKDANGDPTGVFVEREMAPIAELIWFRKPAGFSHADRVKALPESARAYHAFGTTSVFEGHGAGAELLRVYKECLRGGTLTMRATLAFSADWKAAAGAPLGPFVEAWAGWLGEPGLGNDWLRMSGLFVQVGRDAADAARASAAPYTGWAGYNPGHGLPREQAKDLLVQCAKNDIRAVVIGSGNLDLYDEVDREIALKGRRWVISHISTLSQEDIERIVRMGLLVTTHTNNYLYRGLNSLAQRLPPERRGEITPLRSLLNAGVKVSLATDNVPVSNFFPISHTIRRVPYQMQAPVAPEQALVRADALRCATNHGAYLTFDEDKKGSLEPGKLADLAVLSADPLTVAEADIADIRSLMTMVGGKMVYETPGWAD